MFVSRFQKNLVILYQSGETQIWFLINVLGAFHLGLIPIITTVISSCLLAFTEVKWTIKFQICWLLINETFNFEDGDCCKSDLMAKKWCVFSLVLYEHFFLSSVLWWTIYRVDLVTLFYGLQFASTWVVRRVN